MTTQTGPPSAGTVNNVTVKSVPLSVRPGSSFLESHHTRLIDPITGSTLTAIRTDDGRWYRDASIFREPCGAIIEVGCADSLSTTEEAEARSMNASLLLHRSPIGNAVVEKTSVFLEADSTISIVTTIHNTTGRWLLGFGTLRNAYDALGVRFLTLAGHVVGEQRVHFPFEMIPPGGSITLRGSIPWAETNLAPGTFIVSLDVVREGVNWSRPLASAPQHPLTIPKTIYEESLELTKFNTTRRLITFTFNAYADDLYVHELLDVLGTMGVVATFFITGDFIRRYPDLVRRIVREHHEVGNLTNSHKRLVYPGSNLPIPTVNHEALQQELRGAEEALRQVANAEMSKIWRAPFGHRNGPLLQWAADIGYRSILWSLDSYDGFVNPDVAGGVTVQAVAARVEQHLDQPLCRGSIILFNAASQHYQQPLYDTIQSLIELAWSRGYSFRTVGEMLEHMSQRRS